MKTIIFAMLFTSYTALAVEVIPYQKTSNKYMVDGNEVSAAQAVDAARSGKAVFKCKAQKMNAVYMINGKQISGEAFSKCTPQALAETANGIGFKAR